MQPCPAVDPPAHGPPSAVPGHACSAHWVAAAAREAWAGGVAPHRPLRHHRALARHLPALGSSDCPSCSVSYPLTLPPSSACRLTSTLLPEGDAPAGDGAGTAAGAQAARGCGAQAAGGRDGPHSGGEPTQGGLVAALSHARGPGLGIQRLVWWRWLQLLAGSYVSMPRTQQCNGGSGFEGYLPPARWHCVGWLLPPSGCRKADCSTLHLPICDLTVLPICDMVWHPNGLGGRSAAQGG